MNSSGLISDSGLSADLGYFKLFNFPKLSDFTFSPYHHLPGPSFLTFSELDPLLYLRFDSIDYSNIDYYQNRTIPSLITYRLDPLTFYESPGICEPCYGAPLRVLTSSYAQPVFNQTFINLTNVNNFTVEFWLKLWNLKGKPAKISADNEIIRIPGVFGIRVNKD